jgi:hypothetical protein
MGVFAGGSLAGKLSSLISSMLSEVDQASGGSSCWSSMGSMSALSSSPIRIFPSEMRKIAGRVWVLSGERVEHLLATEVPPLTQVTHFDLVDEDGEVCRHHGRVLDELLGVVGQGSSLEDKPIVSAHYMEVAHIPAQPSL